MESGKHYITRQQRRILQALAEAPERTVTALSLAAQLRENGLPVGTATVYRHLDKLEEQGLVHKLSTGSGAAWQYCAHPDAGNCILLQCERCGQVQHADCSRLSALYQHLSADHDFAINPHKTVLYGQCSRCQKKE
jgi:Fur family transcriptional regulator, ferric uptake regulator